MYSETAKAPVPILDLIRRFPLAMRVVLSWTLATSVLTGGFVLLLLMSSNRMSPSHMFPVGPSFFVVGAIVGMLHGGLLAYLGRRLDRSRGEGVRVGLIGAALAVVCLVPTAVVAMWIALASHTRVSGGFLANAMVLMAMLVGLALCLWAMVDGWRALRNVVRRWPESRVGAPLLLAILAVAATTFLLQRPEIWWTDIRVTGAGAIILAVGATVWIASPVVVLFLHVVHRFVPVPFEWGTDG